MPSSFVIRSNRYYDSVFLMSVSRRISEREGVTQNAVVMGTDVNKALLADIGVIGAEVSAAGPNDLIVTVKADTKEIADQVINDLDGFFEGGISSSTSLNAHSFGDGLRNKPHANLATISVPGEYAASEADDALDADLNVFLFSDNVTVEDECRLKERASKKGLIVMGPDCGTSIIGGVGIGFANEVRRGPIGVIGVSGTGLQEFTSLVHNLGSGISHAIGTGGRDLSDEVGGISTLSSIAALEIDPQTEVIALISKPPGKKTLQIIMNRLEECTKPVVACFIGAKGEHSNSGGVVTNKSTIDEAVNDAIRLAEARQVESDRRYEVYQSPYVADWTDQWNPAQKFLRGIFAGGTFCYQAQQILRDAGIEVNSNAPLDHRFKLADSERSVGHTIVDMGADEYTSGKPHPMIDGSSRYQRILQECKDPQTAILFVDFILGRNASADPVGDVIGAIREAKENVEQNGGLLAVVASVCGTDLDPQGLHQQISMLEEENVAVFGSNGMAAAFCAKLLGE